MKTFALKEREIDRKWYLVDARDQILGRMASQIANRLRGKIQARVFPLAYRQRRFYRGCELRKD